MKPIKRRSKIIRNPKNINPKRFNSVRSKRRYGEGHPLLDSLLPRM